MNRFRGGDCQRGRRAWAEVDLSALIHNVNQVRGILPDSVGLISVVKADAYGHGAVPIVKRLEQAGKVLGYAVASPLEGAEVREAGVERPIVVFGPVFPEDIELICTYDLSVTVSSLEEVGLLQRFFSAVNKRARVHLKVDTGMGRMGTTVGQSLVLLDEILKSSAIVLEGVYTHFASAGEDDTFTISQRAMFSSFLKHLPSDLKLWVHSDNSAGATVFDASGPWNSVRLGLMQYGCWPCISPLEDIITLKPVLSAHAPVGLVKKLSKGETISYGRTHRLQRDSKIAVVAAGYADGISRQLSNRGSILIRGRRCPILGSVCMDLTIVDITDHPEAIAAGDCATWIGSQQGECISAEEVSSWAGTIPWECLCAISRRVPRFYIN